MQFLIVRSFFRDPELIFPRVQSNNLLGYLIAMSGLPTLVLLIGSLFYHAICGHIHPLESRFVKNAHQEALLVLEARCMLLAYTVLALIAWNLDLSWHLLQFWLWPLLSALPWTQIVGFAEHAACPYTSDMLANSRTTFANRLFSVLWWNANHHTAHHKYPTVPFFNLPSVTKLLQQEGLLSSVSASYVSFHYQFLTGKLPVYQSN
jgi:fatty acid desaturase